MECGARCPQSYIGIFTHALTEDNNLCMHLLKMVLTLKIYDAILVFRILIIRGTYTSLPMYRKLKLKGNSIYSCIGSISVNFNIKFDWQILTADYSSIR